MPARYAALLRGINVGTAKRISMGDLKRVCESLACTDVRTLLNSGNIVFTHQSRAGRTLERQLETAIDRDLGVFSRVTLLSAGDFGRIMRDNPLEAVGTNPSLLFVGVLNSPSLRAKVVPLAKQRWGSERFHLGDRAAYLWCPGGSIESPLYKAFAKALGEGVTSRNWATMGKIATALTGV